jgi:hypothetical protein
MTEADLLVRRILDDIEPRIDLRHVERVCARHRAALAYEALDIPPLVCYIPYEGKRFEPYPYPEAFADPAKMMVNELLLGFTSIYHAVSEHDDAPLCLRPNLGTVLIASMFGSQIRLVENNMPWAAALGGHDRLRAVVESHLPAVTDGLGQRVLDQYAYYHAALRDYPNCRAAFEITFPDLQSPFDTAELLWGSSIFPDLFEHEDLVRALLDRIAAQMLAVYRHLEPLVRESLRPAAHWQHACAFNGKMLLRSDSCILMSPRMYREIVMPCDARLAAELGSIGIHFCGDGHHQIDNMLAIPGLQSLDFGQPHMMDTDAIYQKASARRVVLMRMTVPDEQLTARQVRARFPAGVILIYTAASVADAHQTWERYCA